MQRAGHRELCVEGLIPRPAMPNSALRDRCPAEGDRSNPYTDIYFAVTIKNKYSFNEYHLKIASNSFDLAIA
jgi:hypothetical protein